MPGDLKKYKPAAASKSGNFTFRIKWKNTRSNPENAIFNDDSYFTAPETCTWDDVKNRLKGYGAIRVTYFDAEGDEIPIESQCEFREFRKYFKKNSDLQIFVERLELAEDTDSKRGTEISKKNDFDTTNITNLVREQKLDKMAPKDLTVGQAEKSVAQTQISNNQTQRQTTMASSVLDFTEFEKNALQTKFQYNEEQIEGSGDAAPKWFTNYMQTMKDEMVNEISQRVTTIVMEALTKKRESHYDTASSHPHASDSEYLLDSDSEYRTRSANQTTPYFSKNREKKLSDPCARSLIRNRFENSRSNYRHTQEKQRKKRSKNHPSNPPNTDEIWHSPSFNRRRGEKTAKNKREFEEAPCEARPKLISAEGFRRIINGGKSNPPNTDEIWHSPSFNRRRGEQTAKNKREFEEAPCEARPKLISAEGLRRLITGGEKLIGEELKSPNRQKLSSAMQSSSSTRVPSADVLESPISKLRLANPYKELPNETEEKVRMGCSVTGQDLLEKPNDRSSEYCALSDSDNISIISDVSLKSERFTALDFRSSPIFFHSIEDDLDQVIIMETERGPREPEDPENARDSSSFELLSDPPASPPLSIHMDEDHFATAIHEPKNYNINDDTTIEKRGNHSKIDKCPYAIDAHGKIYQRNIVNGAEESPEIALEKRTGGAYSFVGETLPTLMKEGVSSVDNCNSPVDRNGFTVTDDDSNQTAGEPDQFVYHTFYDSTQSFHSHIAQQAENNRHDFTAAGEASSQPAETSRSHVFADHNVSKGLGDTKKSSPKKQTTSGEKRGEDSGRSERMRSNRKSSQDSQGSSANRNNGPRNDPRSKRFANWSTTRNTRMMDDLVFNAVDPMHILPETLVTGAVHVAFGAYTTARRVYDKILTAQTTKPADRSQPKFGRR